MATAYRPVFTDATRPDTNVERVGTLAYSHPIVLPEDVQASFDVATPPLRVAAIVIDLLIIAFATFVLQLLSLGAFVAGSVWALTATMLLFYAINMGYFFVFEGFFAGQTPGKRILRMRVITQDGQEIGPRQGLVRAFTRIVELGPVPSMVVFGYFAPGMLVAAAPFILFAAVMFVDKRSRRLGDFAAGTIVVRQKMPSEYGESVRIASYFELQQRFFPLSAAELARLSPEDYVRMEEFGTRIRSTQPHTRIQAAMAAATGIATKMKYSHAIAPQEAERFIFEVHAALKEQLRQLYPDLYG